MDNDDGKNLEALADSNISAANEYLKARMKYAEAKLFLDLKLATELPVLRKKRSNIGYDMAIIMLVENNPLSVEIRAYYEDYVKYENRYKGLDKIINAQSSRVSVGQSIIKNKIQQGG